MSLRIDSLTAITAQCVCVCEKEKERAIQIRVMAVQLFILM